MTTVQRSLKLSNPLKKTWRAQFRAMDQNAIRPVIRLIAMLTLLVTTAASSETVDVKYRGAVDLKQ